MHAVKILHVAIELLGDITTASSLCQYAVHHLASKLDSCDTHTHKCLVLWMQMRMVTASVSCYTTITEMLIPLRHLMRVAGQLIPNGRVSIKRLEEN